MRKKIFYNFAIVSMVGITMWALLMGFVGVRSEDIETAANTEINRNWGLSFQVEGQSPIGNATSSELKKYNAYYIDEGTKDKSIYLTFDAGYENGYTEKILDVLKKEKVKAAFFLVGDYIKSNPEIVRRMEKEGHMVGNHTMTHPDMSMIINKEVFENELVELANLYKKTTGKSMKKVYRPPQGKFSEENLKMAQELGYYTFFWSLAYVDWYVDKQPTREEAINILNNRIHDGAIVLLHSTSKTNSEILEELIQRWKSRGYKFKSLDEIVR